MKYLLTIADGKRLDIYAVDGRSLLKHWFMDVLEAFVYNDILGFVCHQLSWEGSEMIDIVCILPSSETSILKGYFADTKVIDMSALPVSLGCENDEILIETREKFLLFDKSDYEIRLKEDVFDAPANLLTAYADMKFMSIGCVQMKEESFAYCNTKRFFKNLMEHMPEDFEVVYVPVFASCGSDPLLSDRGFVEIFMKEKTSDKTIHQEFDELLMSSLSHVIHKSDLTLVYNDYLKKKLFI